MEFGLGLVDESGRDAVHEFGFVVLERDEAVLGSVPCHQLVQFEVFESVLMLEGSPVVSEEGPTTDNYTGSLTQAPAADVMVTISPDLSGADDIDLGSGPGNPVTLTFTTDDWTPRSSSSRCCLRSN